MVFFDLSLQVGIWPARQYASSGTGERPRALFPASHGSVHPEETTSLLPKKTNVVIAVVSTAHARLKL